MTVLSILPPMTAAQRRRLQMLWHRWMDTLHLMKERDRELRHAYIQIVTRGRAWETNQLTIADAALVIRRLKRALRATRVAAYNYVLGTAGRQEYEEHGEVVAAPFALRLLHRYAEALAMTPAALNRFIAAHYAGAGLKSQRDLRTMADLNRVLWGLKALLRRRAEAPQARKRAA